MWVVCVLWMELRSLFVLILEKKIIAQRELFMNIIGNVLKYQIPSGKVNILDKSGLYSNKIK